ncbi:MAG: 23S rRNA (pseudouridine(1915)-N(3))-methyltransferase RlmH [Thermaurantiacus sp.]
MRLQILASGKAGRSPEAELTARYLARIPWPTRLVELGGPPAVPPAQPGSITVVLDARGTALSSELLAARLGAWRDDGVRETRFLIGPADGWPDDVRRKADFLLAFGPATWPHLLVRAMLAEQLFRATSILAGHPYHRSG